MFFRARTHFRPESGFWRNVLSFGLVFSMLAPGGLSLVSLLHVFISTWYSSMLLLTDHEKMEWRALAEETLAPDFSRLCDSICYADDYTGLFTMHYGL